MSGRGMNAVRAATCLAVVAVMPAFAQTPPQFDVNATPVVVEPLPPPGSPVRSQGAARKRGSDAAEVGRDLDAASRRVQSDNLHNEIRRGDEQLDRDRVQTQRQRATSDPQEAARLRQDYNQRLAEYERWRNDKQREREDQESKGAAGAKDAKESKDEKDTYRTPTP